MQLRKHKKIFRWIGILIGLPASMYFVMCAIFYAWLNAATPERWPSGKAAIWSGGSLLLAVLFLAYFVWSLVDFVRCSNAKYRSKNGLP
jgi:hypothetical protein